MPLEPPSTDAIRALAPNGTLRAAINISNFLLVTGKAADGNPEGVSPDMARELARRLEVGIELLRYRTPSELADAADADAWDIGNIGAEPARAKSIAFTAAYCEIEATYLVPGDSPIRSIDEVDRAGIRIACASGSAYGLWLERNIKHAELVLLPGAAAFDAFVEQKLDAYAGLRAGLVKDVARVAGARILEGRFTAVQQAMGTPRNRGPAGFEYLQAFVEDAKASGLVAQLIAKHRVQGLTVAPAASAG